MSTPLCEQPASPAQRRRVGALAMVLVALGIGLLPVAGQPLLALPASAGFYALAMAIVQLVCFVLLSAHHDVPRAQHLVAAACLYSGSMAVMYLLHYPGAVLPGRAIVGGEQAVSWLFIAWRVGFPSILLWAVIEERRSSRGARGVYLAVPALVALAVGFAYAAPFAGFFPDAPSFVARAAVSSYLAALIAAAAVLLMWRAGLLQRALYVWLSLILVADVVGLLLSTYGGARYTVGWYASRAEGLLASLVVLALLVQHFARVQRSLTQTVRALEQRTEALQAEMHKRGKAEGLLLQAQKLEAVGQLAAGLAHDFNNLLQVVGVRLELVRRKVASPQVDDDLAVVRRTLARAEGLTRRLLVFSGRRPLQPQTLEPADWLAQALPMLSSVARADAPLTLDAEPGIWPVQVDPAEFESTLVNLVSNARDAMPGGGRICLLLRNEPAHGASGGDHVSIAVRDDGTGIRPEVLERVFEPFFTTKEAGRGSGLGLSQVHAFVHHSGGTVAIDSAPGRGTTVTLRLPRAAAGESGAPPAGVSATAAAAPGRVVLVVDDNDDVRDSTGALLELQGWVVRKAASGDEALALLAGGLQPHAVVSDVVMPQMDGITLARRLRHAQPALPIVLCTGFSAVVAQAHDEGFDVLSKPYTAEALAAALGAAMA
jgi:signal transduction histidine kinase